MKRLIFPLLLVAFGLNSCNTLSKLTQFEKSVQDTVTIPVAATLLPFPVSVGSPEIKTDMSKFLSDNKIDITLIDKVTLKKLEMTIITPDTCTFKFLSSVEVSIYTSDSTVTKIASLSNVPANKMIDLNVESADLKKIILIDPIKLVFKITCNQAIKSDYKVLVKPTFLLDVNVLGM